MSASHFFGLSPFKLRKDITHIGMRSINDLHSLPLDAFAYLLQTLNQSPFLFPHHTSRQGSQWPRGLEKFPQNIPPRREIVLPHTLQISFCLSNKLNSFRFLRIVSTKGKSNSKDERFKVWSRPNSLIKGHLNIKITNFQQLFSPSRRHQTRY